MTATITRDALLANGRVVQIRPIEPSDAAQLVAFHERLSPETTRFRFFAVHPRLSASELERFTNVDHRDREALIALLDGELVGVARYVRLEGTTSAEAAFVVADALQGSGVGSLLLEHLAARAREEGIDTFEAHTLADNRKMLRVFADSGLEITRSWDGGVAHLMMPLELSPHVTGQIVAREHIAESRSIERLLRPRSIVVIGASARAGTVGHEIVRRLVRGGFNGPVYPVNANAAPVAGLQGYGNVSDIPHAVDLAIVAVPSAKVVTFLPACAAKGVQGLVVISGGFAEAGPDGVLRQRELVAAARRHGMRVIGPNCVGIVNTAADIRLDATFGAAEPIEGRVALASQSGAVGIAVLDAATRAGIGASTFVSLGNKADVSSNDLLQYWAEDEATDVVMLYLESFGNPAKFARLARDLGRRKPIIAVKSGRTSAGRRAASSHTAAMAASDDAVDALLRSCGVVRVDSIDELLDTALVLAHQPLPGSNRVAIIGNSGGPGVMAADAASAAGLELAPLDPATCDRLRQGSAASAAVDNPVDLLGDVRPDQLEAALDVVLADPNVDAAIVIYAPTLLADTAAIASTIAAIETDKPIVSVLVGRERGLLAGARRSVPVFASVESAVAALGHASAYAAWRHEAPGAEPARTGVDPERARTIAVNAIASRPGGRWLGPLEVDELLDAYGLRPAEGRLVLHAADARREATELGFPVVLKAQGPQLVHKSDVGGVVLGLRSAAEVGRAWRSMKRRLGDIMTGALVQRMVLPGVELIAGIARDDTFGPLVLVGMGGTLAELVGDRALQVAPMTDADAARGVASLRCAPLLDGYRGSTPVDKAAVADVLMRLGLLARDVPEVVELDLNPLIATPDGVVAVDARVRVAPPTAPTGLEPARALAAPRPFALDG